MISTYRVSAAASRDIQEIARYTLRMWGETQQRRYLTGLEHCFDNLVDQPGMGVERSEFKGMRSIHHGHHMIFYTIPPKGVLIVRVLHERQDPMRYLGH